MKSLVLALVIFWIIVIVVAATFLASQTRSDEPTAYRPLPRPAFTPVVGSSGATPVPATVIPRREARESAVGSHRYPGPVRGVAPHPLSGGQATWYDDGPGLYAAVGTWRYGSTPYRLRVCLQARCVTVIVRDFCRACFDGRRLIDLSPQAFGALAPLSRGVINVEVYRG